MGPKKIIIYIQYYIIELLMMLVNPNGKSHRATVLPVIERADLASLRSIVRVGKVID